ncbi:MAG: chromosome segregation protein SMC, partial [Peptococcaceae bacterium]|nr:chromosome segregation protein SMC [Peptococcaceae bacterium]
DLDFEEVTVSRRLYRSGESEYLINKAPSRLRDIQELFMDTGLGREGLSIISQGKVDEILSLKPEDRRGLIEEAAGIIKYKYRKREAERKLKDTDEHLVRVEDIISELEERVGPLGEQAEKAKQYHIGKEELDQLEISMEVHDIARNQVQEKQLSGKKQELENQMASHAAGLSGQEAELAELRFASQQQESAFQEKQQAFYDLQNQLERRTNQIAAASQLLENTADQISRLDGERIQQQSEMQSLQNDTAEKQKQAEEAESLFRSQQGEVIRQNQELRTLETEISKQEELQEAHKNAVFANMQEQARNNNALQRLEQELSGGDRSREKIGQKLAELEAQLEKQKADGRNLLLEREALQDEQTQHNQAVSKLEHEIEQRKHEQFVMRQNLTELQSRYQEQQSRAKALKELEESGEGYQYGVKSVLEQKNRGKLSGIIGTVSQLITVPQHLEKAIETTMGTSLQNLVTEDDKQAQTAIQYLKEHKKGRATFLPLNTVKGQRAEEDLSDEKNVLGLAVDLIEFDDIYEKIMLHLLGKVWVIEDLPSAVAIGKKRGFSHRMVTLDGELVTPGGALTGGNHDKERGGLLARQRQIAELEEAVKQLADEMDAQNAKMDAYYAETGEKKQALNDLHGRDEDLIRRAAQLDQQLSQQDKEEKRIQNEIRLEQFSLKEQESLIEGQITQQKAEAARRLELQEKEQSLNQEGEALKEAVQAFQQKQKELQAVYNQNSIQLATAQQRWEMLAQQAKTEQQRLDGLVQALAQKEEQYAQLLYRKEQYEKEIAENRQHIAAEQEQLSEENQVLLQYRETRQKQLERIGALEDAVKAKRQSTDQIREQKYQLDIQLNKIQGYLAGGYRRLAQNFDCTYEEAQEKAIELENIPQAQKRIQQLKGQLNRLGEINFTAIEEFEQVKQRLEFLKSQINDLLEAKQSLNKVIQEMEKIMAQKFAETYKEVNARFTEVFQSMFGGGQAHLELSDPEDYLLTGIEIVAQPPGKKEQVLTLLSGGERAMTAIALLFSLLTVKPSPFCILDEIESALDDVNIDRFARFIREYAEKTQFLIISHRKGTMEAADVLYGVAMENKGVSRLMSVKVSDYV